MKRCFAEKQQLFVLKRKNERHIDEFFGYWCAALLCPLKQVTHTAIVHWILINLFLITILTKFCNFSPNVLDMDKWFKVYEWKRFPLVTLCNTWFPISNLPFPTVILNRLTAPSSTSARFSSLFSIFWMFLSSGLDNLINQYNLLHCNTLYCTALYCTWHSLGLIFLLSSLTSRQQPQLARERQTQ